MVTVLHSPTLETIRMVESTVKDAQQVISVAELKRRLPRQVNHNTLKEVLAYLEESGKIAFTVDGILWIHTSPAHISEILATGRRWS